MLVQHTGTYSPILDTLFTFPTIGLPQQLRTKYNGRLQYWRTATKNTTNYGYIFPRQLTYFGPRIFIPGLSGFFYCLGYGSTSSSGNG